MQTYIQKEKVIFIGKIKDLKFFLKTMTDKHMTLTQFISVKLH